MVDIPAALLDAFPPSADALLDRARRGVDDAMLTWIARADYGIQADEMLALLRPIRDTGIVPASVDGQLEEVLQLTRWSMPERPNPPPFEPGPTGLRGHQTRLFACAVLLRLEAEPATRGRDNAEDATLGQCLASARVLGDAWSEAAACFLTWVIQRREQVTEPLLLALGLLLLATRLRSGRFTEPVLGEVADWVFAEEARRRQAAFPYLADLWPAAFGPSSGDWGPLAAELNDEASAIGNEDVRTKLLLCATLLESGPGL